MSFPHSFPRRRHEKGMVRLYFFFIGNKDYIQKHYLMQRKHKAERKIHREKKERKEKEKERYWVQRRELRNIGRESLEVSPHALDQSNKVPLKEANSWSSELSMSSNVLLFRSLQRHHVKHNGAKFQMLDEYFPSQFHQPKRVSAIDFGRPKRTQRI